MTSLNFGVIRILSIRFLAFHCSTISTFNANKTFSANNTIILVHQISQTITTTLFFVPLFFQDVITSGSSVLETAALLRSQGLVVDSALVFLDRQQGGQQILAENGINVFCVTDIALLVNTQFFIRLISDHLHTVPHCQTIPESTANSSPKVLW